MSTKGELQLKTSCYHCGDPVEDSAYILEDHRFCCLGCQTVYQILNDNNMASYYKYNSHPGKSQKAQKEDLSYLDEPNIIAKLVDYQDDELAIITFYVPAIHCSSCIWLLEHLYKLHPGVKTSQVDFMKKQASITFKKNEISLRELVELLHKIGYDPKITLQDVVKEGKKINQSKLIAKITVAGFCFGNSMMISFPEYFGMAEFERQYSNFFGYMNLAFGLPVLLYSASDYFKSAWLSLNRKGST
ncbi:heavy metal translocating P-type ATPase metal-binding domain-containing protein [Sphingobacterium daejeonense]|uniref:heavy metal translocating P-type ATPase metal-binding domain-containing protein n=1 Tax=Sphingobacterium daejeonense TaxID=371142 RepID=UPI0010C4340F|nr:heavy metal translocating P-type ATPase metal-binding domain-containing protein [Sphingobacterium daejeonense]VTQ00787.1 copper ion binding protein [Sphingobacterium daejeonense]